MGSLDIWLGGQHSGVTSRSLKLTEGLGINITAIGKDELQFDIDSASLPSTTELLLGDAGAGFGGLLGGGEYYYGDEPGTPGYEAETVFISIHDDPGTTDGNTQEFRGGIEVDVHESGSYAGFEFPTSRSLITAYADWAPTAGTTDVNDNNLFGVTSQLNNKSTAMAPFYMRALSGFSFGFSGAARMGSTDQLGVWGEVGDLGVLPADGTPSNTAFDSAAGAFRVNTQRPNGIYSALVAKSPIGSGTVDKIYGLRVRDQSGHSDTAYAIGIDAGGVGNSITWADDTNLYRSAADTLATDDYFVISGNRSLYQISANGFVNNPSFITYVAGDTVERFYQTVSGKMEWGTGSAIRDTNLYRSAANELKTDDSFVIAGDITGSAGIASYGSGFTAVGGYVGLVNQGAASDVDIFSYVTGDGNNRFQITADGTMSWGGGSGATDLVLYRGNANQLYLGAGDSLVIDPGSTGATILFGGAGDTNLYRVAAGTLKTDGALVVGASVGHLYIQHDTSPTLFFGATNDTNLYRSGADTLKTDDTFDVAGAIKLTPAGVTGTQYVTTYSNAGPYVHMRGDNVKVINRNDATYVPLSVQGMAAQSAHLQRWENSTPATVAYMTAGGGLHLFPGGVESNAFSINVIGAANPRYTIDEAGVISWGAGGGTAVDTNLYRRVANVLKTDDQFEVTTNFSVDTSGNTIQSGTQQSTGVSGVFARKTVITPAQITSNQDNYDPGGVWPTASILRLDTDATRTMTGLKATGVSDGMEVTIIVIGANRLTITSEGASSTAANRFTLPGASSITLQNDGAATFRYDGTTSRWRNTNRSLAVNTSAPNSVTIDGTNTAGDAGIADARNHIHTLASYASTPTDVSTSVGAAGTSTTAPSRGDHRHVLAAHGIASHTDLTRSFYIPASQIQTVSGVAATLGTEPDQLDTKRLDDAVIDAAYAHFQVPTDWASGALVLRFHFSMAATDVTAPPAIRVDCTYKEITGGDPIAAGTNIAYANTNVTSTVNPQSIDFTLGTPGAAERLWRATVRRDASNAGDTYEQNLRILGFEIRYTANQ